MEFIKLSRKEFNENLKSPLYKKISRGNLITELKAFYSGDPEKTIHLETPEASSFYVYKCPEKHYYEWSIIYYCHNENRDSMIDTIRKDYKPVNKERWEHIKKHYKHPCSQYEKRSRAYDIRTLSKIWECNYETIDKIVPPSEHGVYFYDIKERVTYYYHIFTPKTWSEYTNKREEKE